MTDTAPVLDAWRLSKGAVVRKSLKRAFSTPFLSVFLTTFVPITLQAMMASSRTVFDVVMTASLGAEEVAVVGYGSRIVFILILLVLGVCNGAGVLIAQFYGGGNVARARQAIGTAVLLSFVISAAGYALVLLCSGPLADWSGDDPEIRGLVLDYLLPASAMVLPFSISFAVAVGLRSVGRSNLATWAAVIGLISNVGLNYVLIFGAFGAPALGIVGAAYASVISFAIEAVVVCVCAALFFDRSLFDPRRLPGYLNPDTMRKALSLGIPIALGSVVWAVGILAYSIITAMAGPIPLAALALVTPVESMAIAVMIGLSSTANMVVGHSLGRGDFPGALENAIGLVVWTLLAALLMGAALMLFRPALMAVYAGTGPEVWNVADRVFDVLAIVLIVRALNVTMIVGILRACARSRVERLTSV